MSAQDILRLVAAQSTATIGAMARAWLLLLACSVIALTCYRMQDGSGVGLVLALATSVVMTAVYVALPAAMVAAVIHIARKW